MNGTAVFIGGGYQYLKTVNRNYLMAISKSNGLITTWNPNPDNQVLAIDLNGTNAYLSGYFTNIGGQPRNYIAEISLSTGNATAWNPNANTYVNTVKLIGTTIYAGGSFTTIGGQSRNYLAALNNTNGNATTWNPRPDGVVYKIRQANSDIVALGAFTFMNSEQRSNLMAISKSTGLIKPWSPNPNSTVETIELNGTNAYIGGSFTTVGGQPRNYIAEISLSTGNATTWNPDASSIVNTIKKFGTTIYAGGSFTTIGGQSRNYIAALNNSTGTATTWNPNANANVRKLAVSDSVLFVGGDFTTINSQSRNRLSSFSLPNGNITVWNPDVSGPVHAMELTGSNVYVGGSFNTISGFSRNNLAVITKNLGNVSDWNPNINGTVNSLYINDNVVFAGGSFNIAGGQTCSNFAMLNGNSAIPSLFFPQFNSSITCFSGADSTLYVGGSFSNINGNSYNGLASINFSNISFEPSVEYFTPNEGGNGGNITISVYGNGFIDGSTFQLRKQGQPTITVQNSIIINTDGIKLVGIIDLHNPVALGAWDLVVIVPGYPEIILTNSFEVQQGIAPIVWSEINGFAGIRPGIWQTYGVVVGNSGNIDARGVPLHIAIDDDVEVDPLFNFLVWDTTLSSLVVVDTLYHPIPIDTLFGEPFSGKVYTVFIGNIAPSSSEIYNFKLKTQNAFNIKVWTDPPLYGSPMNPTFSDCAGSVLDLSFDFISQFGPVGATAACVYTITKSSLDPIIDLVSLVLGNDVETKRTGDYIGAIGKSVVNCLMDISALDNISNISKIDKFLATAWSNGASVYGAATDGYAIGQNCGAIFKRNVDKNKSVVPINSFDPNDKIGPIGGGINNSINSNIPLPYTIRFENSSTATAAAQVVSIVDTLDVSVYDLSTFNLGSILVGERNIEIPNGLSNYQTVIDLRPSNNLLLKITAGLDMSNGVLTWLFESLDPDTQMPTENPFLGFLPPNLNAPEGDGAVSFTINALTNIPENATISNTAYIYFDLNPAIITNEWTNTVDNIKPISSALPLNPITNSNLINLNWSGSDIGSGIQSFDIYKSVNGGDFTKWLNNVSVTSADFIGSQDSTYSFFSIAVDSAGNRENMKSLAEATTTFTLGIKDNLDSYKMEVSIYPNPNQGNFNLSIVSQKTGEFDLSIVDVYGRPIYSQKQNLVYGNNILPLSIEQTGIYLLTIGNDKERIVRRVVVSK